MNKKVATKVIKTINLELTEEEALDLRTLVNNHIDDYFLPPTVFSLVENLKSILEDL